jgi:S-formylglutathione hydrolase FrmB
MRIPYRHLAVALCLLFASLAHASEIVTREINSAALKRAWKYNVYLPTGYENGDNKYPVLYLLHGNAQNYLSWTTSGKIQATADALIANGDIPAVVIVMPDAGTSWYVDRKEQMETAIMKELMPDVETNLRTLTTRDHRFIAGLSMGGFGAMRFAMLYPEKFGAAALLSPAIYHPAPPESSSLRRVNVFGAPNFDVEIWKTYNYPALWDAYVAKKLPVPMYINSGDDDNFMIEYDATVFYSFLRKNKHPAELRIVNGAHDWPVWSSTIGDAMKYLFSHAPKSATGATAVNAPR